MEKEERRKGSLHLKLPGEGQHLNTSLDHNKTRFVRCEHTSKGDRKRASMGQVWNGGWGIYLCTHTYELEEILYRITIFLFYSNIAKWIFYFPVLSYCNKEEPTENYNYV